MALNISGVAEPAKRVAERPAGEERFNTPQTRDETRRDKRECRARPRLLNLVAVRSG